MLISLSLASTTLEKDNVAIINHVVLASRLDLSSVLNTLFGYFIGPLIAFFSFGDILHKSIVIVDNSLDESLLEIWIELANQTLRTLL